MFWSHPFAATAIWRTAIDTEDARLIEMNKTPTSPHNEKHCHLKQATSY
jgi:hypothetical protein